MKQICRCGRQTDKLTSFFDNSSGLRVTVCEDCANELQLKNEERFKAVEFEKLKEEHQKTPLADAGRY